MVDTRRMSVSVRQSLHMRHKICSALLTGALALGSLFAITPIAMAAEASVPHCVAPADLTRLDLPLRRTASRLASGKLIIIVALGSSSTAGAGASSAATTYPSRLMVELAQRFPTQPITVLNRGVAGERAIDMLARPPCKRNIDLFHRFGLMRHWYEVDSIPFEAFLAPDELHMNDWSYNCFAKALADAIADAATPDRPGVNATTGETR